MNVKIYPEMIPKDDIRISIYPIPSHSFPVPKMGLRMAKQPQSGTEKQQKIRDIRESRCHDSKECLICRG